MSERPISDYAMLSDCRSAALVSTEGSVDWLCLPRFDSPAVFARLLDPDAGHFSIRPAGPAEASRRYLPQSLVLETTFRTPTGTVVLLDAMALGRRERGHAMGQSSPGVLLRHITCTRGQVDITVEYAPRPEFGLIRPVMTPTRRGLLARGGAQSLTLATDLTFQQTGSTARTDITLQAGGRHAFALSAASAWGPAPETWSQRRIRRRLRDTGASWHSWSRLHEAYTGPWQEHVRHSGRVLRGLSYLPTGAIVAAVTTSLPESVGGTRNWDYRYTWVRDASLTLQALATATCRQEKTDFFTFLAQAAATQLERGADLQVMYGIGGERDLSERILPHLAGWRGSTPVRIGNDAWRQRQLDVYGELLDAAHQTLPHDVPLDAPVGDFLRQCAEAAARHWADPDQGIWEGRGPGRHFLHSKLMCWVALDRAVDLAAALGAQDRVAEWRHVREQIRDAIENEGFSQQAGAFTQAFGSRRLDASALMLPLVGFLPADDPRVLSTVEAIARQLSDSRGLVRRYLEDDIDHDEGTFLLCTFWLAQALALTGQTARARQVFDNALTHANDVGLLPEEVDTHTGEALGNFPQAFSHIGLINAAHAIRAAEAAHGPSPGARPDSSR
ncbi:glycoside hydrolase family 15 protein [Streptomyces sp. G-G2]|uniref:glycoside hydrolase family 15 protein n=1 Tax=Streptomyces sp. G-G2 TaxID=3046201 RepID=UPI0024B90000|nr:glycoside hydrolase family 15 protein [Streptomyces sp. G-G2]MDJ0384522.1 glycoside hydrolase family 15 protein [Streptomyces sp. G-G2]